MTASQAGGANHLAAPEVSRTVTVTKAPATVTLSGLSQVYNGTARIPVATTDPAGLTVAFTYDGLPDAPVNVGSYAVSAVIDDPLHSGSASGTLVIAKAAQSISFAPVPDAIATDEVALTATGGGSGNPVTFAVTQTARRLWGQAICSVSPVPGR